MDIRIKIAVKTTTTSRKDHCHTSYKFNKNIKIPFLLKISSFLLSQFPSHNLSDLKKVKSKKNVTKKPTIKNTPIK